MYLSRDSATFLSINLKSSHSQILKLSFHLSNSTSTEKNKAMILIMKAIREFKDSDSEIYGNPKKDGKRARVWTDLRARENGEKTGDEVPLHRLLRLVDSLLLN